MSSAYKIVLTLKDINISDVARENIEGKIVFGENIKYFKVLKILKINLLINNIISYPLKK